MGKKGAHMRDTIDMAREAGAEFAELPMMDAFVFSVDDKHWNSKELERFVALVRADAIADEREACADIADRLPRIYRETAEAHYRLSPEPFKPSQFGFDYAELRQAESITYAIRARGNT
jgi:hypothetical protein